MSTLTESHEYTLEQLARLTQIKRRLADGELSPVEALDETRALELPGVRFAEVTAADLVTAQIAAPPQASRALTPEEKRRVERGLYLKEW
jgi:hypothetical protein